MLLLLYMQGTESILSLFTGQCKPIEKLKKFFHHRWNAPILSAFHTAGTGMRFVVLVNQLGISRDSLSNSLNSLLELDLIARNAGYGHPLRPEYILTEAGSTTAALCHLYTRADSSESIHLRKWTAPILLVCHEHRNRFNDIRAALEVTPRALTQALKLMEDHSFILRNVDAGYPPTTSYQLTRAGKKLARVVEQIKDSLS